MNFSAAFIHRPVATALLMSGLLLLGAVAYFLLPVAPLPQVDFPTIQVTTSLPGTSPETMASSVATPLERQFGQISGVAQLTSVNGIGTSVITIQFELSRNIDAAAQDVQAAINAAAGQLPKDLPNPPIYRKTNPTDAPILILALNSESLPLRVVDDYAENVLAQQLSEVEGVALVQVAGAQKPAVRVELNPAALAGRGVSLEDVRSTLTAATLNAPKGTLTGPRQSYTIENNDQLFAAENYRPLIVAWRNGAPIRLSDVGSVVDGVEDIRISSAYNERQSVILVIQRQPGVNVIDTVETNKGRAASSSGVDPARHRLAHRHRSHPDDPRLGQRCAVHAGSDHRPRRDGDPPLLAQSQRHRIPSIAVPLSLIGTFAVMYGSATASTISRSWRSPSRPVSSSTMRS